MSNHRLAASLVQLRSQVNAAYPGRDKSSDGWIGDAAHASRRSDHNPWFKDAHGVGVVTAIDIDEDLAGDIHSIEGVVSAIRASRDKRVKYIIYERRITKKGTNLQEWEPYHGVNPHEHHAHISVYPEAVLYDNTAEWAIGNATVPPTPVDASVPPPAPVGENGVPHFTLLRMGDKGVAVTALQARLVQHGYLKPNDIDGDFGQRTRRAVQTFQTDHGLRADGIVGDVTRKALGL